MANERTLVVYKSAEKRVNCRGPCTSCILECVRCSTDGQHREKPESTVDRQRKNMAIMRELLGQQIGRPNRIPRKKQLRVVSLDLGAVNETLFMISSICVLGMVTYTRASLAFAPWRVLNASFAAPGSAIEQRYDVQTHEMLTISVKSRPKLG